MNNTNGIKDKNNGNTTDTGNSNSTTPPDSTNIPIEQTYIKPLYKFLENQSKKGRINDLPEFQSFTKAFTKPRYRKQIYNVLQRQQRIGNIDGLEKSFKSFESHILGQPLETPNTNGDQSAEKPPTRHIDNGAEATVSDTKELMKDTLDGVDELDDYDSPEAKEASELRKRKMAVRSTLNPPILEDWEKDDMYSRRRQQKIDHSSDNISSINKRMEKLREKAFGDSETTGGSLGYNRPRSNVVDKQAYQEFKKLERRKQELGDLHAERVDQKTQAFEGKFGFWERMGQANDRGLNQFSKTNQGFDLLLKSNILKQINDIDNGKKLRKGFSVTNPMMGAASKDRTIPSVVRQYANKGADGRKKIKQNLLNSMIDNIDKTYELGEAAKNIPQHPGSKGVSTSQSFNESWEHFKKNPIDVVLDLGISSWPYSAASMLGGAIGGLTGTPAGAAMGVGVGSGFMEFAASVSQGLIEETLKIKGNLKVLSKELKKRGIDVSPEQLMFNGKLFTRYSKEIRDIVSDKKNIFRQKMLNVLEDETAMKRIKQKSFKRGVAVGAFDTAGAFIGIKGLQSALTRQLAKGAFTPSTIAKLGSIISAGILIDATSGGLGETVAQMVTDREIRPGEITAEFLGELIGAPGEIVSGTASTTVMKEFIFEALKRSKKGEATFSEGNASEGKGEKKNIDYSDIEDANIIDEEEEDSNESDDDDGEGGLPALPPGKPSPEPDDGSDSGEGSRDGGKGKLLTEGEEKETEGEEKKPDSEPKSKNNESEKTEDDSSTKQTKTKQTETPTPSGEKQISTKLVRKPIKEIHLDEDRFQRRERLDQSLVNKIASNPDPNQLDPVVLWLDPELEKDFLIAGHHRIAGYEKAGEEYILSRYFNGTEAEAIEYAKNQSNANRSMEKPRERAGIYRDMRNEGATKKEILDRAKELEGRNAQAIVDLSYLSPNGDVLIALKKFDKSDESETSYKLKKIARYVGRARRRYNNLTDKHETQLFNYLKEHDFKRIGEFMRIIDKHVNTFNFERNKPLPLQKAAPRSIQELDYKKKLNTLNRELKDLRKKRRDKEKQLNERQRNQRQNGVPSGEIELTNDKFQELLKPLDDQIRVVQKQIIEHRKTEPSVRRADKNQGGLFDNEEQAEEGLENIGANDEEIENIKNNEEADNEDDQIGAIDSSLQSEEDSKRPQGDTGTQEGGSESLGLSNQEEEVEGNRPAQQHGKDNKIFKQEEYEDALKKLRKKLNDENDKQVEEEQELYDEQITTTFGSYEEAENGYDEVREQLELYNEVSGQQYANGIERDDGNGRSFIRLSDGEKIYRETVSDQFKEQGYISLIGQTITNPTEAVKLLTIHRSPRIEKMHFVFTDDNGKIVYTIGLTNNSNNYVYFPTIFVRRHIYIAKKMGATGLYMGHNHPSGDPAPSSVDKNITLLYHSIVQEYGIRLKGHVVIDTDTFTLITIVGNNTYVEKKKLDNTLPELRDAKSFELVSNPLHIANKFSDFLSDKNNKTQFALILNPHFNVVGFHPFTIGVSEVALAQKIRNQAYLQGGNRVLIIGNKVETQEDRVNFNWKLAKALGKKSNPNQNESSVTLEDRIILYTEDSGYNKYISDRSEGLLSSRKRPKDLDTEIIYRNDRDLAALHITMKEEAMQLIGDIVKEDSRKYNRSSNYGEGNTIFTKARYKAALKKLLSKVNNLMVGIDPELFTLSVKIAGYHIESGIRSFSEFSKAMIDDVGVDIKPYLKSIYNGVRGYPGIDNTGMDRYNVVDRMQERINTGEDIDRIINDDQNTQTEDDDVSSNTEDLERDSEAADTGDDVGTGDVPSNRGEGGEGNGGASQQALSDARKQGDSGVSGGSSSTGGTQGNTKIHSGDRSGGTNAGTGRGADTTGSSGTNDDGTSTSTGTSEGTEETTGEAAESSLEERLEQQRQAEPVDVVPADPGNIQETLPVLFREQQEDVLKAEQRFSEPTSVENPTKGILFTNGTGTGKTYTALGLIKRYDKQGKNNILIVVPTDKKAKDWIKDADNLLLNIRQLDDTNDTGDTGEIIVTTYANMRANEGLQQREFNLVLYDESHKISSGQGQETTSTDNAHKYLTNAPNEAFDKAAQKLVGPKPEIYTFDYSDDMMDHVLRQKRAKEKQSRKLLKAWKDEVEERKEEIQTEANRMVNHTKVVFLSATPFSYHFNLDYADGYLFTIVQGKEQNSFLGYNTPGNYESFYMQHFGYRMKYNELTIPESGVDVDLMERNFYEWMADQGAVSSRILDLSFDYSRDFVLLFDELGNKIDEGYSLIMDDKDEDVSLAPLQPELKKRFNWINTNRLLEGIKSREIIPRIQNHIDMGRQIVLFHNFKIGSVEHPFKFKKQTKELDSDEVKAYNEAVEHWNRRYSEFVNLDLSDLNSTIDTIKNAFGDQVVLFNGDVSKRNRVRNVDRFNAQDNNVNIAVVQIDAGKEGISLHDNTGGKPRVIINVGLPVKPTDALQSEGRIYRIGQKSNAIIEYPVIHTNFEIQMFGDRINNRIKTAENLALGKQSRSLELSFRDGYLAAQPFLPNEDQGTGGKALDRQLRDANPFEQSKTYYFARQKRNSRTKSREGNDYFATPEPLGFKIVEWLYSQPNEALLEPSAGHGAIGRFFPKNTRNTFIEPSRILNGQLKVNAVGNVRDLTFEQLNIINKYNGIAMNPPFGAKGKTAMEHIRKATKHLRDGGRLISIVPTGSSMQKRLDKWMESDESNDIYLTARIALPTVTFERAGTKVAAEILVFDKQVGEEAVAQLPTQQLYDLTQYDDINEFFNAIEPITLPERVEPASGGVTNQEQGNDLAEIVEGQHTKNGYNIWTVTLKQYLGKELFRALMENAKKIGGYYSGYDRNGAIKGFIFRDPEKAQQFLDEMPSIIEDTARSEQNYGMPDRSDRKENTSNLPVRKNMLKKVLALKDMTPEQAALIMELSDIRSVLFGEQTGNSIQQWYSSRTPSQIRNEYNTIRDAFRNHTGDDITSLIEALKNMYESEYETSIETPGMVTYLTTGEVSGKTQHIIFAKFRVWMFQLGNFMLIRDAENISKSTRDQIIKVLQPIPSDIRSAEAEVESDPARLLPSHRPSKPVPPASGTPAYPSEYTSREAFIEERKKYKEAAPWWSGMKVNPREVIQAISDIVTAAGRSVPLRIGRLGGRKAWGFFKVKAEVIRIKEAEDISTAAHELAHALEKVIFGKQPWTKNRIGGKAIKELEKLGKILYGSTVPAAGYKGEGFAEFLTHYLLTGRAEQLAPNFTNWFENTFLEENPKVKKAVDNAREKGRSWIGQGSINRADGSMQKRPSLKGKIKSLTNKTTWSKELLEEFAPLLRIVEHVEEVQGEELEITENPFLTASALRYTNSARARYFIEHAAIDLAGNKVGMGLKQALAPVVNKRKEFTLYLWARRSLKLWEPSKKHPEGRNPGISQEDAQYIFDYYDSKEFQLAASNVYEWENNLLKYGVDAFGNDFIDNIIENDVGDYIPLQRVFDELTEMGIKVSKDTKNAAADPIKHLEGSNRSVKDIFPTLVSQAESYIGKVHKRFVLNQLIKLKDVEGIGKFIERVPRDKVPISLSVERILETFKNKDIEVNGEELSEEDLSDWLTFFLPAHKPPDGDPVIAVPDLENNSIAWYRVNNDLYENLAGMDPYYLPWVVDLIWGRTARMFRAGTTGMRASFALITNPSRDLQTFFAQTHSSKRPDQLFGMWLDAMKNGIMFQHGANIENMPYLDLFTRLGGPMSNSLQFDSNQARRAVKSIFKEEKLHIVKHPINTAGDMYNFIHDYLQIPETATRAAETRAVSEEVGWEPGDNITLAQSFKILLSSKRVTVDFSAAGRFMKVVNRVSPFSNVAIQGPRTFGRTFREHPGRSVAWGLAIALMTLMSWWLVKDEDWYRDIPYKEKFLYWFLPVGDEMIMVPRPQEWGFIFSSLPEAALNSWYLQKPDEVKSAFGQLFDSMNPANLPPILKVAKEQYANEIAYFNRPIVPYRETFQPKEEQFGPYTSILARTLGDMFKVSPRRIDHAIRGFTGGVGPDILDVLEIGVPVSSKNKEEELADIPVVGRLFRRGGKQGRGSQAISDFYKFVEEAQLIQYSNRKEETEEQRQRRLLLQDAQQALSAMFYIKNNTPKLKDRQVLQSMIRDFANDAIDAYKAEDFSIGNRKRFKAMKKHYETKEERAKYFKNKDK